MGILGDVDHFYPSKATILLTQRKKKETILHNGPIKVLFMQNTCIYFPFFCVPADGILWILVVLKILLHTRE